MRVTTITVSYLRDLPPAQYHKACPTVELVAMVDEGEDHSVATRQLFSEAVTLVHDALGVDVPDAIKNKLMTSSAPVVTKPAAKPATEPAKKAAVADDIPDESAEKPKRKRRTKAEIAADKAKEEATKAEESNDIPDDMPKETPSPATDGIPDDVDDIDASQENGMDHKEVKRLITSIVNDPKNKFTVANYRLILTDQFKTDKSDNVPVEQLPALLKAVQEAATIG